MKLITVHRLSVCDWTVLADHLSVYVVFCPVVAVWKSKPCGILLCSWALHQKCVFSSFQSFGLTQKHFSMDNEHPNIVRYYSTTIDMLHVAVVVIVVGCNENHVISVRKTSVWEWMILWTGSDRTRSYCIRIDNVISALCRFATTSIQHYRLTEPLRPEPVTTAVFIVHA